MVHVFGIRHHGPGSTKSLMTALADLQPDCLLIEGPPDANSAIEYVANPDLVPPVALLVYNPSNLKQASYFPFAHFSPEWQALKYGLTQEIPTEFMDLPRTYAFTLDAQSQEDQQQAIHFQLFEEREEEGAIYKDPFGKIAQLAGYEDSERWWEVLFESNNNPTEIFKTILLLMTELRAASPPTAHRELQREAYMRKVIRDAVKKGFQKIAVVCGAWHAPVLDQWLTFKSTHDNQFLKGIKKTKTKATWVPWSYKRLSRMSGYGAGIVSPAWYQLLYDQPKDVTTHWMVHVARLFRKEDLAASSAGVIEAVRLATTLATIRNLQVPGIQELSEAAIAVFCGGDKAPLNLIERKLIIGDRMGEVPDSIPVVPLQQDLMKCIKSARLTKDQQSLEIVEKTLDLRTPTNLLASRLLHRLNILDIPWGKQIAGSKHQAGSFKEHWQLEWEPDYAIRIIEAGMWGSTVYEAATNYILNAKEKQAHITQLTQLIEQALQADLVEVIPFLTQQLETLSALTTDVFNLMDALPSLVNILRYGSSRNLDTQAVQTVVDNIIPRICIGLPGSSNHIDEEATNKLFQRILSANRAIHTLNVPEYTQQWYQALAQLIKGTNAMIAGLCTRILFDKEMLAVENTTTNMLLALSKGNKPMESAKWIEGFLSGSGLLLIYNETLWSILDQWVADLSEERLMEILPVLRRTFSKFSAPERQKMLQLVKRGEVIIKKNAKQVETTLQEERVELLIPVLKKILGF